MHVCTVGPTTVPLSRRLRDSKKLGKAEPSSRACRIARCLEVAAVRFSDRFAPVRIRQRTSPRRPEVLSRGVTFAPLIVGGHLRRRGCNWGSNYSLNGVTDISRPYTPTPTSITTMFPLSFNGVERLRHVSRISTTYCLRIRSERY